MRRDRARLPQDFDRHAVLIRFDGNKRLLGFRRQLTVARDHDVIDQLARLWDSWRPLPIHASSLRLASPRSDVCEYVRSSLPNRRDTWLPRLLHELPPLGPPAVCGESPRNGSMPVSCLSALATFGIRSSRRPARSHPNRRTLILCLLQHQIGRVDRALQQIGRQFFELIASDRHRNGFAFMSAIDHRLRLFCQRTLGHVAIVTHHLQRLRIGARICAVPFLELARYIIDQPVIPVDATQMHVAIGCQHLKMRWCVANYRHIKRASAKIVHQRLMRFASVLAVPNSPRCQAYVSVAAVGSLMMSITLMPAIRPASSVALRRASLK